MEERLEEKLTNFFWKNSYRLMGILCVCATHGFSLTAFKILVWCSTFAALITTCFGVYLFGFFFGAVCPLPINVYFFLQVRKVSSHYFFKSIFCPFFSLLLLGPYNVNINMFDIVSEVPKLPSFKNFFLGVPVMVQQKRICLGIMRLWVWSLALLKRLTIWHCSVAQCRLRTRLRSCVIVAVA